MKSKRRLILLNQMAGPLFRELAEGVAPFFPEGAILLTGHPDTLAKAKNTHHKLRIIEAPRYDRNSMFHRASCSLSSVFFAVIAGRTGKICFCWFRTHRCWADGLVVNQTWRRSYTVLVCDIHPDILVNMGVVGRSNPVVWLWHYESGGLP